MANVTLYTDTQIQQRMILKLMALLGLNDINAASVLDVITQVVAQEDFAQYVAIAQTLKLLDINNLKGTDLDAKGFEFGLERKEATKASGYIQILRETGFTKVSTGLYAGAATPLAGNTVIYVNNASSSLFGTSGSLIIGRGTINEEEVSYSVAPVNNTNYWTFTLDAGLTNSHFLDETVILKQGINQTITASSIIKVPASANSPEINFSTTRTYTLLAGEESLDNVEILASIVGSSSNIPIGYIQGENAFASPPFSGARAYNNYKITNGADRESDSAFRDRIKNTITNLAKGTKQAILSLIVGLIDPDTAKTVVSAGVVLPQLADGIIKVFIDDGLGFEPTFEQQGFETVITSILGGEKRLQLDHFPLVKAYIETQIAEPWDFTTSKTLTYKVGQATETITFQASDFQFSNKAKAEEIAVAVNNRSTLLEARTSNQGTKVYLTAVVDVNEAIELISGTAITTLGLTTNKVNTLTLYKNNVLLNKDGILATLDSTLVGPFDLTLSGGLPKTLTVVVDNKSLTQTLVFDSGDFLDPAAATTREIVNAINDQLAGANCEILTDEETIRLTSNNPNKVDSGIHVTGGTLNTFLGFPTTAVNGAIEDYILNPQLGTIELTNPLIIGDIITTTNSTHDASISSGNLGSYLIPETNLVCVVDEDILNKTFDIPMNFSSTLTSGTSTTVFTDTKLINIFETNDIINDYYIAFKSGANTLNIASKITSVSTSGGSSFVYNFDPTHTAFTGYVVNDLINFSGMQNEVNNGSFIITNIATNAITVSNINGVIENGSTGSCLISQRRSISDYVAASGQITITSAVSNIPSATDSFILIPSTTDNFVDFLNNLKITNFSLKVLVENSSGYLKLTSLTKASDGAIQITGGTANDYFNFNTDLVKGLRGYAYYTGLLKTVHSTIYGLDTDLATYPGIGAAGIQFEIKAPTVTDIYVNLTITLEEGVALSQVTNDIMSNVSSYINSLKIGEDVILERIKVAAMNVAGVYDLVLNNPLDNLSISDSEVARIKSNNITVG